MPLCLFPHDVLVKIAGGLGSDNLSRCRMMLVCRAWNWSLRTCPDPWAEGKAFFLGKAKYAGIKDACSNLDALPLLKSIFQFSKAEAAVLLSNAARCGRVKTLLLANMTNRRVHKLLVSSLIMNGCKAVY